MQHKVRDIEFSLRGILRGFGLKVGKVTDKTFEARIRELVTGHPMLEQIAEAMLAARAMLLEQYKKLHKAVQECWTVPWTDAEAIPIGRNRCDRRHLAR